MPDLGGKIASLHSRPTSREWLWTNPHVPQHDSSGQTDYVGRYDTGGWDEVFPTVDPCVLHDPPWDSSELADHGEIWRRAATVVSKDVADDGAASVSLRTEDASTPFTFDRIITLAANQARLEIEYALTNRAPTPLHYIWATHPLFAIEPGMRIDLPADTETVCTGGIGGDTPTLNEPFTWPLAPRAHGRPLDLSRTPPHAELAMKLFTQPLDAGWVSLTSADGAETLRLEFGNMPPLRLGLWLNYGGWSGCGSTNYSNAGLEPTTSPCDCLADAIERNVAAVVMPGETRRWKVTTVLQQRP